MVRLYGIDAPELDQNCGSTACGREAAEALASRINGRVVSCSQEATSASGVMIAICYVAGAEINRWLVENGMAVAYVKYSESYSDAQSHARSRHVGLWTQGDSDSPWIWRARHRSDEELDAIDYLSDDHTVFDYDVPAFKKYQLLVGLGNSWSSILLAILAPLGLFLTWRQLALSARQARSTILFDLDRRWEGEEMAVPRQEINALIRTVRKKSLSEGGLPNEPDDKKYARIFHEELIRMRDEGVRDEGGDEGRKSLSRYTNILKIAGFFETLGYSSNQEYLPPDDVVDLLGASIFQSWSSLSFHIRMLREEMSSPNLFTYFERIGVLATKRANKSAS